MGALDDNGNSCSSEYFGVATKVIVIDAVTFDSNLCEDIKTISIRFFLISFNQKFELNETNYYIQVLYRCPVVKRHAQTQVKTFLT